MRPGLFEPRMREIAAKLKEGFRASMRPGLFEPRMEQEEMERLDIVPGLQ